MIRILQIVGSLGLGGAQTFLMNLYRSIDRSEIQFDFAIYEKPSEKSYFREAEELGARIYYLPRKSDGILKNLRAVRRLVRENGYRIVWRHTDSCANGMDMIAARLGGADRCILHSHNTRAAKGGSFLHYLLRPVVNLFVSDRFACGQAAGKWMFGRRHFTVIRNGVEMERFALREDIRIGYRTELGLDGKLVIGHVGRFQLVKNQDFLLGILQCAKERGVDAALILVGTGARLETVRQRAAQAGLSGDVLFLQGRRDIPELMQAMDVFVMPSYYEGLPVTLVEAQAAGLPCVVSDRITRETDLTGNMRFVSLEAKAEEWLDCILDAAEQDRGLNVDVMRRSGYDMKDIAREIEERLTGRGRSADGEACKKRCERERV